MIFILCTLRPPLLDVLRLQEQGKVSRTPYPNSPSEQNVHFVSSPSSLLISSVVHVKHSETLEFLSAS